ncbi:MAG: helix-turn-helix transcriptional regulator, partial [Nitrospinota bacterium]
ERGEKCPTVVVVYKISKALNVSICEILSIDNCPHISADQIRKVERLFSGKDKKDIHKAIRILEVFFFE